MAIQQEPHLIKGIQRDLSVSKFNAEFAFDAQNIRITARDSNTLLSVSNERGNKEIPLFNSSGSTVQLDGILLGYKELNDYIILFTKGTKDNIYRLENKNEFFEVFTLYSGNLNFNTDYPMECISIFENKDIQKVYWLDGLNQTRVINIVPSTETQSTWDDNTFDFVQILKLKENVQVERVELTNGMFSSGIVQYAFTYFNKYGQETNIFNSTKLNYISFPNRGASPEEKVNVSFELKITNLDTRFDYVRIYSIHRTSIDAVPTVLNVADIKVNANGTLYYNDIGTQGSIVDPSILLFVGGEEIVFQTMAQKDNTLFLGNAELKRKLVQEDLKKLLQKQPIQYTKREISSLEHPIKGIYPYKNTLSIGGDIKTFKYLEWYRFGVQLQHKTGKWSEPIFIKDLQNTHISPELNTQYSLVGAEYKVDSNIIINAVKQGFVRIRGVVVHPTLVDREVIMQGAVCPTVYNKGDRFDNSPFSQASWFSRPSIPFDISTQLYNDVAPEEKDYNDSRKAVAFNQNFNVREHFIKGNPSTYKYHRIDIVNKGAWAEFRHNNPIPSNWERNAEIQCIAQPPKVNTINKGAELIQEVANEQEFYYVDQSIVTLHSPDIEFDDSIQNLDSTGLKLRIVGVIPFTGTTSDIDIQSSTPANDNVKGGFYKETVVTENNTKLGVKSLISGGYWFDSLANKTADIGENNLVGFLIYPWHRNGSLNNQSYVEEGKVRTAMLSKKKLSNLKFSNYSRYFNNPWLAEIKGDDNHTGITPINIFNSQEQTLVKIPAPKNSNLGDLHYYGNIDKVVTASRYDHKYTVVLDYPKENLTTSSTPILTTSRVFKTLNRQHGYPIVVTGKDNVKKQSHSIFTGFSMPSIFLERSENRPYSNTNYGTDAVRIKYKSTPHAVFAFNYTTDGQQIILPTNRELFKGSLRAANTVQKPADYTNFFWNPEARKEKVNTSVITTDTVYQDTFDEYDNTVTENNDSYLLMAELYRDKVADRFGGQTEEAFENNIWLPAGPSVSLLTNLGMDSTITVKYTEGDCYFQRYDCIKTYPSTLEDQNSVTEIISFMCETRINLDGRYDRNRGQLNNLTMTPENFNKINPVYSQNNNFFQYRGVNTNKFNLNNFPNTITWTKEKQLGSLIDNWTNLTMASTLDLDGDKGEITSLNTLNNEIFCFQKQGLSNILFNSRVQIPTSDGVPIEISNGMKVEGKRYISNSIGCNNKWSIAESPSGLYFIDNITNSLYLFNGQIDSLSDKLGFRQWINTHNTQLKWDTVNYNNYRTFYDKNNNDVYFTHKDHCLCYSELIGQFTSFMSYEKTPAMFNINSDFFAFKDGKMWKQFAGDYNMFFNEYKPFSITLVSNAHPNRDKIFNNLEFRADSWDKDVIMNRDTFDRVDIWNEHQEGSSNLTFTSGVPSTLKKKFRVWRVNLPRDSKNKRDRIRNTWAFIKLGKYTPNTFKTELHDVTVSYTI